MTDGQREEQARMMAGNVSKNVTTTPGDSSGLVAAWMQRLQVLTLIVCHCSLTVITRFWIEPSDNISRFDRRRTFHPYLHTADDT
jgi:hypothetical protein